MRGSHHLPPTVSLRYHNDKWQWVEGSKASRGNWQDIDDPVTFLWATEGSVNAVHCAFDDAEVH